MKSQQKNPLALRSPAAELQAVLEPLGPGWPETGTLDGVPIDLYEARETLAPFDLARVEVTFADGHMERPWERNMVIVSPSGAIQI